MHIWTMHKQQQQMGAQFQTREKRDVTLRHNRASGEPPRTGPRENEARREAELREEDRKDAEKARKPKP